jgi:aerobic carbon-monoxide dehydrogenase medium subunit
MFPAAFDYLRAHSTEEALAHLGQRGADARVLAGGQSLIPAMRFRLARPAVLVDVNPVRARTCAPQPHAGVRAAARPRRVAHGYEDRRVRAG